MTTHCRQRSSVAERIEFTLSGVSNLRRRNFQDNAEVVEYDKLTVLLYFYTAVIRPVLEYAAPVWHYAITQAQTQQLESVQKRAIHIIWYSTRGFTDT